MKRTLITLNVVFAALVLAILLGMPKAQTYNSSAAIAAPAPAPMAEPMPNRCPRIHEAIDRLQGTEEELRTAAHDFCGHKADAIRTVDESIRQLQLALDCAR